MARERGLARRERGELGTLEPWDTFREMERMMRNFFVSPFSMLRTPGWIREIPTELVPDVDLRETKNEVVLSAIVPGMSKDDIQIDVTEDRITISGERKQEEEQPEEHYHLRQQSYGTFNISYALPTPVRPEEVKATYKDGVLEVKMPKAEEARTHKVQVTEQ